MKIAGFAVALVAPALVLVGSGQLAHAVALSACSATSNPPVVDNCVFANFEIDGNTYVNDTGNLDWQSSSVYQSQAYTPFFDLFDSTSDNSMSMGSKESDQTTWSCVLHKVDGKSDLGGPWYSATTPTGDPGGDPGVAAGEFAPNSSGVPWAGAIWFETFNTKQYLFGDFQRSATDGDVHIDYEFNRAKQTFTCGTGTGATTLPLREKGDILITFDTSLGAADISISAFTWSCPVANPPNPTDPNACTGAGSFTTAPNLTAGGTFAGMANTCTVSGNSLCPSGANSDNGVKPVGAFGEAGLNLTNTVGNFTCGEFGKAYMKTRSSKASDIATGLSEVKDFTTPVPFNPGLCPVSSVTKWQADETTQLNGAADETEATTTADDSGLTYTQECSTADQTANRCGTDSTAKPPPLSAKPGDALVYKLIYANTGGGPAPNPVVTDTIPTGTAYVNNSQFCPSGATCIAASASTFNSSTPCSSTNAGAGQTVTNLVWCLPSEAAHSTQNLYFEVTVALTSSSGGTVTIENFATVTDTQVSSDTGGKSNYVAASVTYAPNPALSKKQANVSQASQKCNTASVGSSSPGSVVSNNDCILIPAPSFSGSPTFVTTLSSNPGPGDILEYQLTYSNLNSSSPNTGVVVTDSIPANSTYVASSCSASAGTCISDAATASSAKCTDTSVNSGVNTIVWCISSVAVGASDTLTFQVRLASPLNSGTVITNTANGTSDQGSTGPATVTATVTASPQLGLSKTAGAPFTGGICPSGKTCVTYTITATNTGDGDISGQTITDTFPAGMTFVSASTGGVNNNGTVTWASVSVPAGGSTSVTLTLAF